MGLDNPLHVAFLLVVLLLVFGAKRLPEMGRSLGTGMRGFKEELSGERTQRSLIAEQGDAATGARASSAGAQLAAPAGEPVGAPVAETDGPFAA
jgi:sec-independent protein translocase protein TatA